MPYAFSCDHMIGCPKEQSACVNEQVYLIKWPQECRFAEDCRLYFVWMISGNRAPVALPCMRCSSLPVLGGGSYGFAAVTLSLGAPARIPLLWSRINDGARTLTTISSASRSADQKASSVWRPVGLHLKWVRLTVLFL